MHFKQALGCSVPDPASRELGLPCWAQPGWKSQEEGREELGGRALGKGRSEASWMGGAARLSAPQALVLWAALGAAGKTWGSRQQPLREERGGVPRRGMQDALFPAHIGPAPDPEDWWSYKENLQGNFVPGANRVGTQSPTPYS